jgi:uncharacterized protein YjbI with pentapeptide repeats
LLLLFFELKFLPYHSEAITWMQRITVFIDLCLLWLFWPSITLRMPDTVRMAQTSIGTVQRIQRTGAIGTIFLLTLISPPLLLLVANFPGEALQNLPIKLPGKGILIDGELDYKTLLPKSPFSSLLMLPKFDAVGQTRLDVNETAGYTPQTIVVQGRHLEGANLKVANLSWANLIASDMTDADLGSANLSNAQLDLVDLSNGRLDNANLTKTNLTSANLTNVNLRGAIFADANLTNANLTGADLRDSTVEQPQLDRACGEKAHLPLNRTLKPCPSH